VLAVFPACITAKLDVCAIRYAGHSVVFPAWNTGKQRIARHRPGTRCLKMESSGTVPEPVKGMIRHWETAEYYKGQGEWTSKLHEALRFSDMTQAMREARLVGLKGPCEYVVQVADQIGFRVLMSI
jgi:hypothetical protein